jgi:hypothetical protein
MGDEKPKASPGPWRWDENPPAMFRLRCADGRAVIQDAIGALQISGPDAALISRAPDLLAMLREIHGAIEGWAKANEVANGTCCWVSADSGGDHADDCIRGHVDKPMRRLAALLSELT